MCRDYGGMWPSQAMRFQILGEMDFNMKVHRIGSEYVAKLEKEAYEEAKRRQNRGS